MDQLHFDIVLSFEIFISCDSTLLPEQRPCQSALADSVSLEISISYDSTLLV